MLRKFSLSLGLLVTAFASHAATYPTQTPLFVSDAVPPLNMLVMGRDHKLYYEAYNDASDLNGDGVIDVGYKGYLTKAQGGIDYYGYFNSYVCYDYSGGKFTPSSQTNDKRCSNKWSGDFLNYLTTARMDALRKVLYGGYRATDSETETVLQGVYIPQDAHTWGKEYESQSKDGYLISDYTPLSQPVAGFRHLFAVVSLTQDSGVPQLRTLTNTTFRIWNWVSKERPVAGTGCDGGACTSRGPSSGWTIVPASALSGMTLTTWKDNRNTATNTSEMDTLFNSTNSPTTNTGNTLRCGTGTFGSATIDTAADFQHPWTGSGNNNCTQDSYHSRVVGTLTPAITGTYEFSVDGDDAVDFLVGTTVVASRYGNNGASNSGGNGTTGTIALIAGTQYSITLRHEENGGGSAFRVYWKTPATGTSTMTDQNVRVSVCPDNTALQESNCVAYSSGHYKPTGILHDYGVSNRMYFGMLSGSYAKNLSGGVLRSQLKSFAKEIKASSGQFCASSGSNCDATGVSNGIVDTINKFRVVDFSYSSQVYGCGWHTSGAMTQTSPSNPCYMWGNPVGEMMYETMRYFAGATSPTTAYDYSSGKDVDLGLPKVDSWVAPYSSSGYPACSVPVMTVISDINPSYDNKLPGSNWDAISGSSNPSSISGLNVSTEADKVWAKEGGGSRSVFIGESGGVADSAPTAKTVSNLSTTRGLSPEEPSKQGTFYSAAIAHFGAQNNIGGSKPLQTYAVALASPLPTIKFPVGGSTITVVPFAKSVGGNGISATGDFQPTDQIVDYYVETIANTDASCSSGTPSTVKDCNLLINSGRPYAKFRINYEDVEQGADHDMDAIVVYELLVNASQQLVINLTSEYAAGGIDQHMGYVISGTTRDGIYLEVKDQGGANIAYKLDTPDGKWAGECALAGANCAALSRTASSRTFSASGGTAANLLKSPLWYAAKYGLKTPSINASGDPENYFLVTNALTLKDQLDKAFNNITQRNSSVSSPSVDLPRENETSDTDIANIYRTDFNVDGWTGDLLKQRRTNTATTTIWRASEQLPTPITRNIKIASATASNGLADFTWSNLAGMTFDGTNLQAALNKDSPSAVTSDGYGQARVEFIRGDDSCGGHTGCSTFRKRGNNKLGDIVNSSPVLVKGAQYLAYRAGTVDGTVASYTSFQNSVANRTPIIYVGANDGMLHAFNANTGVEVFAFIPTAVIENLNKLTSKTYGTSTGGHQYYVDGSMTVADVYFGNDWHTVLVGSLGGGGREVFALDITNPNAPKLLWEFTSDTASTKENGVSSMGYSFPRPAIARLHDGSWAALVANGYSSTTGKAVLYAVNIADGTLLKALPAGSAVSNGLSSVRTADVNADGVTDYAYAGDLQGNLWRFDLINAGASDALAKTPNVNASTFATAFGGQPLYTARVSSASNASVQPITAAPALVNHPNGLGYIVTFGTGRYLDASDKVSPFDVQTMYGIWDRTAAGQATSGSTKRPSNRDDLQQQTMSASSMSIGGTSKSIRLISQNTIDWYKANATGTTDNDVNKWGWYLDLKTGTTNNGERLVYSPMVYGEGLIFSTITPNADVCSAGLTGFTYGINPYTGGSTSYPVFDLTGDGKVDGDDAIIGGFEGTPGGITISGGESFDTTGSGRKLGEGPNNSGRQSWRLLPENKN